ncbi:MAG TPA: hypothetical protein VNI01_14085, partial [Elusimicrobiota bacterium]|nr:hypothetical protein [Elusimicrobiota bacterium]
VLPAWSAGRFAKLEGPAEPPPERARRPAQGEPADLLRRALEAVRARPLLGLAAAGLLLLLLMLDLAGFVRGLQVRDWLPVSFDGESSPEKPSESRGDALALVASPKQPLDAAARSAVSDPGSSRVPAGSLAAPGKSASLGGILRPDELKGRSAKAVEGLESSLLSGSVAGMDRTRVAREGSEDASPYGPAYPGVGGKRDSKANQIRAERARHLGAFGQVQDVPASKDFRAADGAAKREVPKGASTEDMAEAMLADGDLLKSLRQYAKDSGWRKLQKTSSAVPMNTYDGQRLLTSESVGQLLETKRNADSSLECGVCAIEDRVTDNRATYFGEKY